MTTHGNVSALGACHLIDIIQRGDGIHWRTDDNPNGAGIAWGSPALTYKGVGGRWIVSVFCGSVAIPIGLEQITGVWRGEAQVWPPIVEQLELWAEQP